MFYSLPVLNVPLCPMQWIALRLSTFTSEQFHTNNVETVVFSIPQG